MKWVCPLAFTLLALSPGRADETSDRPAPNPGTVAIFVSADIRGYLGPCGCSEAMRGGIARAAQQIAEARAGQPATLFVDGGDALFGRSSFSPAEVPQEELKAKTIARAFKAMKLAARAIGDLDNVRGPAFRKSLKLPELQSGKSRIFDTPGLKVAIAAARTEAELISASRLARQRGAGFVLGLFYQTVERAQSVASDPDLQANILFATRAANELDGEDNHLVRSPIPVVQIQSKGRSLARVEIAFGQAGAPFELQRTRADVDREISALEQRIELLKKDLNVPGLGKEIKALKQGKLDELVKRREAIASTPLAVPAGQNAFAVRFIPLESSLPSEPEVQAITNQYEREVGLLNLAWARKHGKNCPSPSKGEAKFVGNEACRECHEEAFPVWEKSKHAHAYQTLVDVGRRYDLNCVGCHVTGFDKPGGVCRIDKVEGRKNVGCENCHGPGSIHSAEPEKENILAKLDKSDCLRCHNPENSTHFEFSTYLPQILGPGHGGNKLAEEQPRGPQ